MRAARLVDVGTIRCEEAPVRPPDEGEVIVRTARASICGSDVHAVFHGLGLPDLPAPPGFPGHEGVGEIVESRDPAWAPGAMVLTVPRAHAPEPGAAMRLPAAFAEYQTLPGSACVALPDVGLPASHLLMGQQLGTVVFALSRRPVDVSGKTVCVLGQGSAGLFFTQLLRAGGAVQVITSDLSANRRRISEQFGATDAIDARNVDVGEAVMDITDGRGADYVVEAVGRRETLPVAIAVAATGADILFFGIPDSLAPVPFDFNGMFRKQVTVSSAYSAQTESGLRSFRRALHLIASEAVDVEPMTRTVVSIDLVGRALEMARRDLEDTVKVSIAFAA